MFKIKTPEHNSCSGVFSYSFFNYCGCIIFGVGDGIDISSSAPFFQKK
jgi:hypothetical protein